LWHRADFRGQGQDHAESLGKIHLDGADLHVLYLPVGPERSAHGTHSTRGDGLPRPAPGVAGMGVAVNDPAVRRGPGRLLRLDLVPILSPPKGPADDLSRGRWLAADLVRLGREQRGVQPPG